MLIVRPLQAEDSVEEITDLLHRAYLRNARADLRFVATHQSPSVTAERLAEGTALVAELDGRIVGTVTVHLPEDQPYGEYAPGYPIAALSQYAVDPDLRGKGIGEVLLSAAEGVARSSGFREIALDTAQPASGLIAHYQRKGFQIVARADWRPHTNYESWVLAKTLIPTVRTASSSDFPSLAALKARAFQTSYLPLIGGAAVEALLLDATREWFEARVLEGHTILIAEDEGQLAGLAVYGPNTLEAQAERELRNVYVDPDVTSRGVGRALAIESLRRMRDEGVRTVSLGVFPANVRAIAFYERLGFERHRVTMWTNHGVEFADQVMLIDLTPFR